MAGPKGDSGKEHERRRQILGAAERLLRHYGYAKTTVADIASEAGVGVGTVYLEFSSKNEIIGALAQDRHERLLEPIRAAIAGGGPFDGRLCSLIEARLTALFEIASEGQHGTDLVSCACPAVDRVKSEFRAEEEALLAELLASAHASGELEVPQPERTVRIILRIYESFSPVACGASSMDEIADDLVATHALILDGLRRRHR